MINIMDMLENETETGDIVFASADELVKIVEGHTYKSFVWPHEGEFKGSNWKFNDKYKEFQPILVDATTASLLVKVLNALSPEISEGVRKKISESRVHFIRFVDKSWEVAK